jgi:GDP-L-fucose synthase
VSILSVVYKINKSIYDEHTEPMLSHINVRTGIDCTIRELVKTVAKVAGFENNINFDATKPDGATRKLMNVERPKSLGWQYTVPLENGLTKAYEWFLNNQDKFKG